MLAQDQDSIHRLISSLKEYFLCTDEGLADSYLGAEIKVKNEGLTLCQPQQIQRTIKLLKLANSCGNVTYSVGIEEAFFFASRVTIQRSFIVFVVFARIHAICIILL